MKNINELFTIVACTIGVCLLLFLEAGFMPLNFVVH